MKKLQSVFAILSAILTIMFALPASAGTAFKAVTLYKDGQLTILTAQGAKSLSKLTVNSTNMCVAVNVAQKYSDVPTAGPASYYFAVPASCVTMPNIGVMFDQPIASINLVGVSNTIGYFEVFPLEGYSFDEPNIGYGAVGDQVYATSNQQVEFKIGTDTLSAYTYDTFIQANIAGTVAYGERKVQKCTASGCIVSQDIMPNGVIILDKAIMANPGTAIVNESGQTIGILVGYDKGMSVVISIDAVLSTGEAAGLQTRGRKG